MPHRKKLIEVALPLEAINEASAREKSIRHGHPSTLHLWWARRPLAAARAVIFTSLVDDPDDPDALPAFVEACKQLPIGANVKANGDTPRMRLFDFIEKLVTWEATTDEKILNTARELIQIATEGNPPPLLDPFAGGGSIPLEAQRLGLEAHASDLNPVPVIINRTMIQIPSRFSNNKPINPIDRSGIDANGHWAKATGLATDIRYYGELIRQRAEEKLGHLYPRYKGEIVVAWIWVRAVKSPNPAVDVYVPLANNFWLSKKKGDLAWIEPSYDKGTNRVIYEVKTGKGGAPNGTMDRAGGVCLVTGVPITREYIRDEAQAGRLMSHLMAIITQGAGNRNFHSPDEMHETVAISAQPEWSPSATISTHPQYMAPPRYGMTELADLFTKRQLTTLTTYIDLIKEIRNEIINDALTAGLSNDGIPLNSGGSGSDAYADAVMIYLTYALDKMTTTNSALCSWQTEPTRLIATFGRQAVVMAWLYAEANPFSDAAGDFRLGIESLTKVIDNLPALAEGFVSQADAINFPSPQNIVVSTDPPYYDNVPYADLSDLFYVWMRQILKDIFPKEFSTLLTPKNAELVADQQRHKSKQTAQEHFEQGLLRVFRRVRETVTANYPFTVYYAFKQAELDSENEIASTGWDTMLQSLIDAGFTINGTWPVRTELTVALKKTKNFLASSIILVCRPRPENATSISRRAFLDDLRRELPAALKAMQSGNIAPVDLAQASIGPGMAIYSRYSKVLEADGSSMSVRTALGLINAALDEYLAEQDGDIDADTRFAVSWFTQFGFNEGEFGQADVLARAKNTSVAGVEAAGVVVSGRGKVKLKHWMEYDPGAWDPTQDKRPTVWEATHHLIERLLTPHSDTKNAGEQGAAMLMQKMPSDMAAEARQLAYRLYSICERKGWADHARDYNALVISWSGIGEETARLREAAASGDATNQPRLFDL